MGVISSIKELENTMMVLDDAIIEFYKGILSISNNDTRGKLLVDYEKIEQASRWHHESVDTLIKEIDNAMILCG